MRALAVVAVLVLLAACGGARPPIHHEIRWPAIAEVPLEHVLLVTAAEAGLPAAMMPDGTHAPVVGATELPYDAAGIHARSGVFGDLWYAEVVLGDVDPDAPLPLVVALHGRGDRPRMPAGPFVRTSTPMRVLIPRGPLALGDGYAWGRYSVTAHRDDELAADLAITADRLARLVEHVRAERPTLGSPIVTGFSQGAILGWIAALRHPDSFGLALLVAGWVPPLLVPDGPAIPVTHVRAMHGVDDPIVPVGPTREVAARLAQLGHDVELVEVEGGGHVVDEAMNARFEGWLEAALAERAPGLGGGLGVAGLDAAPSEPFAPALLDDLPEVAVPAPLP